MSHKPKKIVKTIFDFSPTDKELSDLRFTSFDFCLKFGYELEEELTPELYIKHISQKNAYYDLGMLFDLRGDQKAANQYFKLHGTDELLGMDYETIGV